MIINVPQKRKEFERLLLKLGYRDRTPIIPKQKKVTKQINYMCNDGAIALYLYAIPYYNKKSFVYLEFLYHYHKPGLEQRIKKLTKSIYYHEKTRLGFIGWEAKYTKQPNEFSLEDRKKIFFNFLKEATSSIENGFESLEGFKPKVGDILVGQPQGVKINQGFTDSSIELGTRQRGLVGERFGLSKVDQYGFQYARYDENLILRPI